MYLKSPRRRREKWAPQNLQEPESDHFVWGWKSCENFDLQNQNPKKKKVIKTHFIRGFSWNVDFYMRNRSRSRESIDKKLFSGSQKNEHRKTNRASYPRSVALSLVRGDCTTNLQSHITITRINRQKTFFGEPKKMSTAKPTGPAIPDPWLLA